MSLMKGARANILRGIACAGVLAGFVKFKELYIHLVASLDHSLYLMLPGSTVVDCLVFRVLANGNVVHTC